MVIRLFLSLFMLLLKFLYAYLSNKSNNDLLYTFSCRVCGVWTKKFHKLNCSNTLREPRKPPSGWRQFFTFRAWLFYLSGFVFLLISDLTSCWLYSTHDLLVITLADSLPFIYELVSLHTIHSIDSFFSLGMALTEHPFPFDEWIDRFLQRSDRFLHMETVLAISNLFLGLFAILGFTASSGASVEIWGAIFLVVFALFLISKKWVSREHLKACKCYVVLHKLCLQAENQENHHWNGSEGFVDWYHATDFLLKEP